jgi:hypothetical protein
VLLAALVGVALRGQPPQQALGVLRRAAALVLGARPRQPSSA